MVAFTRRHQGQRQHLTVRPVSSSHGGARLIVAHPDGLQQVYCFRNERALFDGTLALQAQLTDDGWEPIRVATPTRRLAVGCRDAGAAARA